jgi:hypothetical protein
MRGVPHSQPYLPTAAAIPVTWNCPRRRWFIELNIAGNREFRGYLDIEAKQKSQARAESGHNTEKDPDDWVSGDGPMTGAQASYLKTLAEQAGEPHAY